MQRHLKALSKGGDAARDALISDLIDEFGTGRVMFSNRIGDYAQYPGLLETAMDALGKLTHCIALAQAAGHVAPGDPFQFLLYLLIDGHAVVGRKEQNTAKVSQRGWI